MSSAGPNDPAFSYCAVLFSKVFAAEYEFSLNTLQPDGFCLPGQSSPHGVSSSREHGWAFPALGGQAQLKEELVCG